MVPLMHTSCSLVAEFLSLYAFFSSYKARVGADSLLFAFPRVELNIQVSGFSWTVFLGMLTSYLQKLALAAMDSMQGAIHGWEAMWVRHKEC